MESDAVFLYEKRANTLTFDFIRPVRADNDLINGVGMALMHPAICPLIKDLGGVWWGSRYGDVYPRGAVKQPVTNTSDWM